MKWTIIGAGAWGTALGLYLARLGHQVTLMPRRSEHAEAIRHEGENRAYLPGFSTNGLEVRQGGAVEADAVLLACPSKGVEAACRALTEAFVVPPRVVISLCKGFDTDTGQRPTEVLRRHFPGLAWGVLSGPSYAVEVAAQKPTALVLASENPVCFSVQEALSSPQVRIYTSEDVVGVELGGCLKNVYAIGAGLCDGLNLGDNARAAYLTRVLHEMVPVGVLLGGQKLTFLGLSGLGDLVATCSGAWSRNRSFGEAVARGANIQAFVQGSKKVIEGYGTTRFFHEACQRASCVAPILEGVYRVLYEGLAPDKALRLLMERPLKME